MAATSEFIISLLISVACGIGFLLVMKDWSPRLIRRGLAFAGLGLLVMLTARAAFMGSYINYDLAKEYLVYAHGASGIKQVMAQAKEISHRTTGGMGLALAYDASAPDTPAAPRAAAGPSQWPLTSAAPVTNLHEAWVLGNGDLAALVNFTPGEICFQLGKSDIWDARFDARYPQAKVRMTP